MNFEEFAVGAHSTETDYAAFIAWMGGRRSFFSPGTAIASTPSGTALPRRNADALANWNAEAEGCLVHGTFGLVTEAGELSENFSVDRAYRFQSDRDNVREEIGDCAWYLAILARVLPASPLGPPLTHNRALIWDQRNVMEVSRQLCQASAQMLDKVKRFLFYGKDFEMDAYLNQCWNVEHCLMALCADYGFLIADIMQENNTKLRTRYPEKFDTTRAYERDLEAERKAFIYPAVAPKPAEVH